MKDFVIVAYDISDDRRRLQVAKILKDYGTRVQYSVFECLLDKDTLKKMEQRISREINQAEDNVRIYVLSKSCQKDVIVLGEGKPLEEEEAYII